MTNHDPLEWRIEPLASTHNRAGFSCCVDSLDRYFQKQIERDVAKKIASAFLLIHQPSQKVCGYYTLLVTHLDPIKTASMTPRQQRLPATLLCRLAVDAEYQQKGLGKVLLLDAMLRSYRASHRTGSLAMIISAMIENVEPFYEQFGFRGLPSQQQELFLPMAVIGKLLQRNAEKFKCGMQASRDDATTRRK